MATRTERLYIEVQSVKQNRATIYIEAFLSVNHTQKALPTRSLRYISREIFNEQRKIVT